MTPPPALIEGREGGTWDGRRHGAGGVQLLPGLGDGVCREQGGGLPAATTPQVVAGRAPASEQGPGEDGDAQGEEEEGEEGSGDLGDIHGVRVHPGGRACWRAREVVHIFGGEIV